MPSFYQHSMDGIVKCLENSNVKRFLINLLNFVYIQIEYPLLSAVNLGVYPFYITPCPLEGYPLIIKQPNNPSYRLHTYNAYWIKYVLVIMAKTSSISLLQKIF